MNKIAENFLRCGSPLSRRRMQSSFWLLQFSLSRCNVTKICFGNRRICEEKITKIKIWWRVYVRNFHKQPCSFFLCFYLSRGQIWGWSILPWTDACHQLFLTQGDWKEKYNQNRAQITYLMNLNIWNWLHISKIDSNYIVITW